MPNADRHTWELRARFRRHAFGWKSQPAITSVDVRDAYKATMAAAERLGNTDAVRARIRAAVAAEATSDRFVTRVLGKELGQ